MTTPSLVSRTSSFRSLLLGALLVAPAALAAGLGGSVVLKGTVASAANIESTTTALAGNLPMVGQGIATVEQRVLVADIDLFTNNLLGLKLTVDPGNGKLTKGSDTVEFKVLAVAHGTGSGGTFTDTGVPQIFDSATQGLVAVDLYIAYTPAPFLDPGDYGASITLTVADNA